MGVGWYTTLALFLTYNSNNNNSASTAKTAPAMVALRRALLSIHLYRFRQ